mgnify:FL=1
MSKVIRIEKRHPETALENLNRLTGLDFQDWPESLLECGDDSAAGDRTENPKRRGERGLPPRRQAHQGG